jgi:hypothetical protein
VGAVGEFIPDGFDAVAHRASDPVWQAVEKGGWL